MKNESTNFVARSLFGMLYKNEEGPQRQCSRIWLIKQDLSTSDTRGIAGGQGWLVNSSRLGIPAFVQSEGIHGFLLGGAIIFNPPIAYG